MREVFTEPSSSSDRGAIAVAVVVVARITRDARAPLTQHVTSTWQSSVVASPTVDRARTTAARSRLRVAVLEKEVCGFGARPQRRLGVGSFP